MTDYDSEGHDTDTETNLSGNVSYTITDIYSPERFISSNFELQELYQKFETICLFD